MFGSPVYIHIPKEKWTKLEKGIFVGYSENSKAYRIYFPGFNNIDISGDVTFDEDLAYNKSRKRPVEDPKETEAPKIWDTTMNDATPEEDQEIEEHQKHVDPTCENNYYKRKPTWVWKDIQVEKRYGAPEEMHIERKRSRS